MGNENKMFVHSSYLHFCSYTFNRLDDHFNRLTNKRLNKFTKSIFRNQWGYQTIGNQLNH